MMARIFFIALMVALAVYSAAECEVFKYETHGKRDPFVPLIGQEKAVAATLADVTSVEDIKLEGIAVGPDGRSTAIINGEIVKEGYKAGEIMIKSIEPKGITLLINNKAFNINLPEEGGLKSD